MKSWNDASSRGSNSRISTSNSSSGSGQSSSSSSTVSKFVGLLPERTPSTTKSSGARVLTSAECLSLLEEKEEKKKTDKEEKEQRKLTREINKRREKSRKKELKREQEKLLRDRQKKRERKLRRQPNKQLKRQTRQLNKQLKNEDKEVLALVARDLFQVILPKIVLVRRLQDYQRSTTLTPISVALALDYTRTMWVLAVNGSNVAVLGGSMRTVWKILCAVRMAKKKFVLYVFLKFSW